MNKGLILKLVEFRKNRYFRKTSKLKKFRNYNYKQVIYSLIQTKKNLKSNNQRHKMIYYNNKWMNYYCNRHKTKINKCKNSQL